jgi:signal transduction histidine kinase
VRLNAKFALLVVGIVGIPFLVTGLVFSVQYLMASRAGPLPNYLRISNWLRSGEPPARKAVSIQEYAEHRPEGLELVLIEKDDSVSFSTIPEFAQGEKVGGESILEYVRGNSGNFHFQFERPHRVEGVDEGAMLLLKLPRMHPPPPMFLKARTLDAALYGVGALVIFSACVSFFIARSLNRSIVTLEGATRRIAEGDLDFELPVRGRDEIASLTRSFESMRAALKEEYARRARFIMGVSHDLRTPLALIQGYVEAIQDGYAADPDSRAKYLSIILQKTHSLEGMVGDLIDFVRMNTGEWRMTFREVALRSFLLDVAHRFEEDALILHRKFHASIEIPEDFVAPMDGGLVGRALENLIGNAIRYTPEAGSIGLSARVEGGEALIIVSDTGVGIPAEDLPRIFDPFYRGSNSRREPGFGLGLTTVRSILESHGWGIHVDSGEGAGTRFTVRIPRERSAARPEGRQA